MNKNKEVIKFVKKLCKESGEHKLLYLTKVGSHLYGTNNENSDEDYRFIFLPKPAWLLTGKNIKHLTYSSGNTHSKNTREDIDVQGWTFQYFCDLLEKGDSNAVDLLFSHTNKDAVLYQKRVMKAVWKNWPKFFNKKGFSALLGLANSEVKKYGLKSNRMQLVSEIYNDPNLNKENDERKLYEIFDYIFEHYEEKYSNLKFKFDKHGKFLVINDSEHLETIKISEFIKRMKRELEKYGNRTKKTVDNKGYDNKSISNAIRCYYEYLILVKKGKITFPLDHSITNIIKSVKKNKSNGIDHLKSLSDQVDKFSNDEFINKYDRNFIDKFIIFNLYSHNIY